MSSSIISGFVAYPSSPQLIGDSIEDAITELNKANEVKLQSWKSLKITGRPIIRQILDSIEASHILIADLTGLNPNVLFEVGYAIARNKPTWFTLQTTRADSKRLFDQFGLLTTYGYAGYANHRDIIERFYAERPNEALEKTIFSQSIKANISLADSKHILYLKLNHADEASIKISRRIAKSFIPTVIDDPRESLQWLTWYGKQVFNSAAVLCHLAASTIEGATLHNARQSLVAGMGAGFNRPLLMLREGAEQTPLDYRELLESYFSASLAEASVDRWLTPLESEWARYRPAVPAHAVKAGIANELRSFTLGEHIAENEDIQSLTGYFVETAAYRDALDGRGFLFTGRKGSGKSANFLKLKQDLQSKSRVLLCVIKPAAYELDSLVSLMSRIQTSESKPYTLEAIWKFLMVSEIANVLAAMYVGVPSSHLSDDQRHLLALLDRHDGELRADFSIRLESAARRLLAASIDGTDSSTETRKNIAHSLHDDTISQLRLVLGRLLKNFDRVAVLIDNLDKPWDRGKDLAALGDLLLALMSAAGRIQVDFGHHDSRRDSAKITWAIFLRSDIFLQIKKQAREPDKITPKELRWDDHEMLLRVVEDRYAFSKQYKTNGSELWTKCFCADVDGMPTSSYILSRIMPRPRDLLFLITSSINWAINRGHLRVEAADIRRAEVEYSKFALESMMVENGLSISKLRDIITEFYGSTEVMTVAEARSRAQKAAQVDDASAAYAVKHLCSLGFFGVEVSPGQFRFTDEPDELEKNLALSRRSNLDTDSNRLSIATPFHAYLEIQQQPV